MHEVRGSTSDQNARENARNICDFLTGKYAGPFAGIITVAYLKVLRKYSPIHTDVFWMQGDIICGKAFRQGGPESERPYIL